MRKSYSIILILFSFALSVILTSCCADNECAEEDIYGKTIIKQTDTIYNKNPRLSGGPYSVQIGAFANRNNADEFARSARNKLSYTITVKQTMDGIYRILIGEYKTMNLAEEVLIAVKDKGYSDSFIRDEFGPVK